MPKERWLCLAMLNISINNIEKQKWLTRTVNAKTKALAISSMKLQWIRLDYYQFTTMGRHTQKAKPVQGVSLQKKKKKKHKETITKLHAPSTT